MQERPCRSRSTRSLIAQAHSKAPPSIASFHPSGIARGTMTEPRAIHTKSGSVISVCGPRNGRSVHLVSGVNDHSKWTRHSARE